MKEPGDRVELLRDGMEQLGERMSFRRYGHLRRPTDKQQMDLGTDWGIPFERSQRLRGWEVRGRGERGWCRWTVRDWSDPSERSQRLRGWEVRERGERG
jgi:hypothetical protein